MLKPKETPGLLALICRLAVFAKHCLGLPGPMGLKMGIMETKFCQHTGTAVLPHKGHIREWFQIETSNASILMEAITMILIFTYTQFLKKTEPRQGFD